MQFNYKVIELKRLALRETGRNEKLELHIFFMSVLADCSPIIYLDNRTPLSLSPKKIPRYPIPRFPSLPPSLSLSLSLSYADTKRLLLKNENEAYQMLTCYLT